MGIQDVAKVEGHVRSLFNKVYKTQASNLNADRD